LLYKKNDDNARVAALILLESFVKEGFFGKEEVREFVGVITVSASSIQIILKNRVAGRYTNNNAWQFFNPNDTSMNRVAFVSTVNYYFGRGASSNS
jgi:hypothetical protein